MANNRELAEFGKFVSVDNITKNVGIATTVRISAGGLFVGAVQAIRPDGTWGGSSAGIQGAQGTSGVQGTTGTQGIQGITGAQGFNGTLGTQGTTGTQGTLGTQGTTGTQGTLGTQGISGPVTLDSGTLMLFQQTSAPTGWTKQTTHNNKALRVVSGTASSGGTTAFTTVFASRTPAGTVAMTNAAVTLATSQIPSHNHTARYSINRNTNNVYDTRLSNSAENFSDTTSIQAAGGGGSHTHSNTAAFTGTALDFAVQYVDLIIAAKN